MYEEARLLFQPQNMTKARPVMMVMRKSYKPLKLKATKNATFGILKSYPHIIFNKPCFYLQRFFYVQYSQGIVKSSATVIVNQPFKKDSEKNHYLECLTNQP